MRIRNENHSALRISFYFRSGWRFAGALYEKGKTNIRDQAEGIVEVST